MKKNILLLVLLCSTLSFATPAHKSISLDPVVIEITDTTMNTIYYSQTNYSVPTKLVFTNLTSVSGYIYFAGVTNLVEVDFPLLTDVGRYIYFTGNTSLVALHMPHINTIHDNLYVAGNTSLTTFTICSLQNIFPGQDSGSAPYYYLQNNTPAVDALPQCFSLGGPQNLALSNNTVLENMPINTVIGVFSADTNYPNGSLTYYFADDFDNRFTIVGNQLLTRQSFDFEANQQYTVRIGVRNQLGERMVQNFVIDIINVNVENFSTVEVTDTTMENVYYSNTNFLVPTKLIFTNLTSVAGYVYFQSNPNLVGVEFPQLTQTGRYFYFAGNLSLESVKAPNLHTIHSYIYVAGNTNLTELQVCNLANILPGTETQAPYYYLANNSPTLNATAPCFTGGGAPYNLALSNHLVSENMPVDTLIGDLSASTNYPNGTLAYYLSEDYGSEFKIIGNQLFTNRTFDYEVQSQYTIRIGVINQLGEEFEMDFTIDVTDIAVEPVTTIEITDAILENVYYSYMNFTQPTKLVFTNLTSVSGYVYFQGNSNLVEVEFPLLAQTGRYFYVAGNASLVNVQVPAMSTVHQYLYVAGNAHLTTLNVCNLSEILALNPSETSYYYIQNNPILDMSTTCLTNMVVAFHPADPIIVLPPPNTLIGTFSSDASGQVSYFFADADGNPIANPNFIIVGNGLYLANEYSTYTESDFIINIGAIRTATAPRSATAFSINDGNELNERTQLLISFNIENAVLSVKPIDANDNTMVLYPNPASESFGIQSQQDIKEIQLYDMLGRKLRNLKTANHQVDVAGIPSGNYLVSIKTASDIILSQKLVIKK